MCPKTDYEAAVGRDTQCIAELPATQVGTSRRKHRSKATHAAGGVPNEGLSTRRRAAAIADHHGPVCRNAVGDAVEAPSGVVPQADHTGGCGPQERFLP